MNRNYFVSIFSEKIRKLTIMFVLGLLVFSGGYAFAKIDKITSLLGDFNKTSKKLTSNVSKTGDNTNVSKIEEQAVPGYSLTILGTPVINDGWFDFDGEIDNISVSPFLTSITLSKCKFVDNDGNYYEGNTENTDIHLIKALLPNEKTEVEFKRVGVNLIGGKEIINEVIYAKKSTKMCKYDSNGNYKCSPIEGIKFTECIAIASSDSSYDNQLPIIVNFPH